jgi:AAA domain
MAKTGESHKQQSFPHELLEQPAAARLAYFKAYTVAHPLLSQADKAVWNAIREPAGALLIFVFGPTGVGKTTLLSRIEKRLIEQALPRLELNPDCLPVVKLDAISPATRHFKWPDFYTRAHLSVQEPLIEAKVDYHQVTPVFNEKRNVYMAPRSGGDAAALRLSWEQVVKHRQPAAILIDEAQHFAKMARGSKLLDQLDHLKSLAVSTQTVHVLVGTYDLLIFRNLSAQLSRRSIDVHFPRYNAAKKDEQQAFQQVLLSFQRHLPLEEPPDLVHQWKYCYARTVGGVGSLKDWLTKALAEALENGEKTITPTVLEHHAASVDRCDQMIADIEEGEKLLTPDPTANERLLLRLGLSGRRNPRTGNDPQKDKETVQASPSSKSRSGKVGQRNQQRDPVKPGK